eukprot:augustus_masked-scaffold_7-processed-gene-5.9-mRNA-1 protein AED:0.03 eAED:0.04 QI:0/-1/0/1/-1/1/1/0/354
MDAEQIHIDVSYKLDFFPNTLEGKVAIISGATRGIGRACALKLASLGCNVVIAAKSDTRQKEFPGTIFSVAEECKYVAKQAGYKSNKSFGFKIDMRNFESLKDLVYKTVEKLGRIDIVVNNASALWWQDIVDTPVKRMDMIYQVNARGTFLLTQLCLPFLSLKFPENYVNKELMEIAQKNKKEAFGRVINMSPQILGASYAGSTAYNITKLGMTMVAMGVHEEYKLRGIDVTGNSLWPATVIESYASINFELGERKDWRKAEILADAVLGIIDSGVSGEQLLDDVFLSRIGLGEIGGEGFKRYRCDPDNEPPRALARATEDWDKRDMVKRGSVTRLDADKERSAASVLNKKSKL